MSFHKNEYSDRKFGYIVEGLSPYNVVLLRRLERVFRRCSVCEAMEDYKEGYLMGWANYVSLQLYCWAIL